MKECIAERAKLPPEDRLAYERVENRRKEYEEYAQDIKRQWHMDMPPFNAENAFAEELEIVKRDHLVEAQERAKAERLAKERREQERLATEKAERPAVVETPKTEPERPSVVEKPKVALDRFTDLSKLSADERLAYERADENRKFYEEYAQDVKRQWGMDMPPFNMESNIAEELEKIVKNRPAIDPQPIEHQTPAVEPAENKTITKENENAELERIRREKAEGVARLMALAEQRKRESSHGYDR